MENRKNKVNRTKYAIPEDTDPVELAAEMKKGMFERNKGKTNEQATTAELPDDPIEFARRLKKVVSEDFLRSYNAIRKVVIKH